MYKTKQIIIGVFVLTALFGGGAYYAHAALTNTQINAIISLLESFGSSAQTTENVRAALEGRAQGGDVDIDTACVSITHDLYIGQNDAKTNGEVSELQNFLRDTGDFQYSSITGYYGSVTERAVQRFQERMGVVSGAGAPGYGRVGPQTRAAISDVPCRSVDEGNNQDSGEQNRTFSIQVQKPNGGELFSVGDPLEVTWDSQNIDTVEVILFTPDVSGASSTINISGTIQNTGKFTWALDKDMLPTENGVLAKNYGVRVRGGTYSGVYDSSNEYFSVTEDRVTPLDLILKTQATNNPSVVDVTATVKGFSENERIRSYITSVECQEGVEAYGQDGEDVCGTEKRVFTANMADPTQDQVIWQLETKNTSTKRAGITISLAAYDIYDSYLRNDSEAVALAAGGTVARAVPVDLNTDLDDTNDGSTRLTASIGGNGENETVGYWILHVSCDDGIEVSKGNADVCGTDVRVNTDDIADPIQDHIMLEGEIMDNRVDVDTSASVALLLTAYDRSSNAMGSDSAELVIE